MKVSFSGVYSRQLTILVFSVVWLLATALIAPGCSLSGGIAPLPQQAEDAFKATIGIPIELQVRLLTEKNRYQREDWIGIWVENRTNHVLRFKDQSLESQVYQYDKRDGTWRLALESIAAADPHEVVITPGPRSALPIVSIPVEWIKVTGTIRLVITGTTDQGQPFAAYKDIEIVD